MINVIDTFIDFKEIFKDKLNFSIDDKIKLWEEDYMVNYPKLLAKCKDDYTNDGYQWDKIAREIVFSKTKDDFKKMIEAYNNIRNVIEDINKKSYELFNLDLDINIVLYSGLCNSAGWVDEYDGKRAILYGIEKIAELNWHKVDDIKSLLAHELCHVIHFEIRGKNNIIDDPKSNYEEGIWRLYTEGFAQFYQIKLTQQENDPRGIEWIKSCNENINQLKKLYIKALHNKEKGTNDFYGDWWKVIGISDTGYYLGQEFIKLLSKKYSLQKVSTLKFNEIEKELLNFLRD
jgi:uncharacterized protein YjaZ